MRYKNTTLRSVALPLFLIYALLMMPACPESKQDNTPAPAPVFNVGEAIRNLKIVGVSLKAAGPTLQSFIDAGAVKADVGNTIVAAIDLGAKGTAEAIAFLEAGDFSNALQAASKITSIVDRLITKDSKVIPAGKARTLFLVGLMAADVALAIIADSIPVAENSHAVNPDDPNAKAVKKLKAYAKKPRLRARDKKTGRFVSPGIR